MSHFQFDALPVWARMLSLAANLLVGVGLGTVHFGGLRRAADMLVREQRMLIVVGLLIGRWLLLGGGLFLASLQGGIPLIAMAVGVLIARLAVVRKAKGVAP